MGVIIEPTTEAKDSQPFVVQRGETVGVSTDGLAGAEKAVVMRENSFKQFVATTGGGSEMTETEPSIRIIASGTYMISKDATVSPSGTRID